MGKKNGSDLLTCISTDRIAEWVLAETTSFVQVSLLVVQRYILCHFYRVLVEC